MSVPTIYFNTVNDGGFGQCWGGLMDDICVFSVALTPAQSLQLYNTTKI